MQEVVQWIQANVEGFSAFAGAVRAVTALLALVLAAVGTSIAFRTYKHRRRADDRAAWWDRLQLAVEQIHSGDPLALASGVHLLDRLSEGEVPDARDDDLVERMFEVAVERIEADNNRSPEDERCDSTFSRDGAGDGCAVIVRAPIILMTGTRRPPVSGRGRGQHRTRGQSTGRTA